MRKLSVCKFGGSSTASWDDVKRKRKIIEDDCSRQIVVVSAHGKALGYDKDTNMLIEIAKSRDVSGVRKIMEKARAIYPHVSRDIFDGLCGQLNQRVMADSPQDAYEAAIRGFGEELCAKLHAASFGWEYIDPSELFVFDGRLDDATINPISERLIRDRFNEKLNGNKVFVVPGYFGYTSSGTLATLSRGGSDLTGSYIAAALEADLYENFTDTPGIAAASPKIVKGAKKIDKMTYEEIRSLAYSGFSVLQEEAMIPVAEKGIPIHVRSTFDYPCAGTVIVQDRAIENGESIIGVAYRDGFAAIDIDCFGLNDEAGIAGRILGQFTSLAVPVEYITTGIDDMSVIFRRNKLNGRLDRLIAEVKSVVPHGKVGVQENLGALVVAGKGLKGNRGIAAKIQECLAEKWINISFISQGPSERCIVYGVKEACGNEAVNAVYDRFLR